MGKKELHSDISIYIEWGFMTSGCHYIEKKRIPRSCVCVCNRTFAMLELSSSLLFESRKNHEEYAMDLFTLTLDGYFSYRDFVQCWSLHNFLTFLWFSPRFDIRFVHFLPFHVHSFHWQSFRSKRLQMCCSSLQMHKHKGPMKIVRI